MKKKIEKKLPGLNFLSVLYCTTPSFYKVGFTSLAIDLPKENLKSEHPQ